MTEEKEGGRHRDPEGRRAKKGSEAEILGVKVSKKLATEDPKKPNKGETPRSNR